jgi:hypothetical protein
MPADNGRADYRANVAAHLRTDCGANLRPNAHGVTVPDASSHASAADAHACYYDDNDFYGHDDGGADRCADDGSTSVMPRP